MPLRDMMCPECSTTVVDMLVKSGEEILCPACNSLMKPCISYAANYTIAGDNGGSTRPKKSRSTEKKT